MSRVGKQPVTLPKGVSVQISDSSVAVKGPKGNLSIDFDARFSVKEEDGAVVVTRPSDHKKDRALHGLYRALIQNMVTGTTEGFSKVLELRGVGYRAKLVGKQLDLSLGFSHPVLMDIPEGIAINVDEKANTITVSGADRQLVGQTAANIRQYRPVEPYKGKGVRYLGERVMMKAGKAGGK